MIHSHKLASATAIQLDARPRVGGVRSRETWNCNRDKSGAVRSGGALRREMEQARGVIVTQPRDARTVTRVHTCARLRYLKFAPIQLCEGGTSTYQYAGEAV